MQVLIFILVFIMPLAALSQPSYNHLFHERAIEGGNVVVQIGSKTIVAGIISDPQSNYERVFLLNTDASGNILSKGYWGDSTLDYFVKAITNVGEDFVIAGSVIENSDASFFLLKLDTAFNQIFY